MNLRKPTSMGVTLDSVSPSELLEVLVCACSQDPVQVQASSKRLKDMLEILGVYDTLQEIATQRMLSLAVRQQAIIQLKNAALGHWKSRKVLSDEHRIRIRGRCLSFLDEEDETIAECNKLITSRIARHDYPNNWPNLMNDLMSLIDGCLSARYASNEENSGNTLRLRRSLQLLNSLLKEFASMKMLNGIKIMAGTVEQLRLVLFGYYSTIASHLSPRTVTPQNISLVRIYNDLLLAHLVYKCLARMGEWLWNRIEKLSPEEYPKNQEWICGLFQNSAVQLRILTQLRKSTILTLNQRDQIAFNSARPSIDILSRHIRLFGKFFHRLQQLGHAKFAALPLCGDLVLFYWSQIEEAGNDLPEAIADSNVALYPVRFLVQGMVLFKDNLTQWTPLRRDKTPNKNSLSQEFVENAVRLLVTRFMPLNPADLESWMADPEEWVNVEDKESDRWIYEIRPCSERVLMQLSNQFPEFVIPLLRTTFQELVPLQAVDLQQVIQKEALYCAIGRCAIRLQGKIPFEEWLGHTLASEARSKSSNYPIIKRRIAWVLGKWITEQCTSPNNPEVWDTLLYLLKDRGPGTDSVVRMTAAGAIGDCVDSLDFSIDVFEPFLPGIITELVRLIGEADTLESKRRLEITLNIVIRLSGKKITPFASIITESLPHLWTSAGEDWLFKASLLVTMTKVIEAVKEASTHLGGIVVPLIQESLRPGVIINLDEDGLNLWSSSLRNTMSIASINGAPGLIQLFPQAITLLGTNLDLLGKIIVIFESYLLIDAVGILQCFADDFFRAVVSALKNDAPDVNMRQLVSALNLLIQIAPSELWGQALHTSGLFAYLLMCLIEEQGSTMLLTECVYFAARLVMVDRHMFVRLVSATASSVNKQENHLYEGLLDQWWRKFDNMGEPRHRKLTAMGIASLVSTGRPEVLERLHGEIFNLWLDVFGEIKECQFAVQTDVDLPGSLRRQWELDEAPAQNTEGSLEFDRRKAVNDHDPVRTTQLTTYVRARLEEAEVVCGSEAMKVYLSKADTIVLQQVQELIRI